MGQNLKLIYNSILGVVVPFGIAGIFSFSYGIILWHLPYSSLIYLSLAVTFLIGIALLFFFKDDNERLLSWEYIGLLFSAIPLFYSITPFLLEFAGLGVKIAFS